jgi:hypothetical protein
MKGAGLTLAADRLDDVELVEAGDPGDVLRQIATSAAQVRMALRACEEADLSALSDRPRAIVVAGPADLLAAVAGPGAPVPVVRASGYQLPGWVGAADLVIAASGAEEALVMEAVRRGSQLAVIAAETDPLRRIAEQARAAFVPVRHAGLPRTGLWSVVVPMLVIAERLGVARVGAGEYESAAAAMEDISHQCRPASESFVNPGKSLALDLAGTLPVIWAGSPLAQVAAHRFARQLALSAKYPALAGTLPDVVRDQLAMFDGPFAPGPEPDFPDAEFPDDDTSLTMDAGLSLDAGPARLRLVLLADDAAEQPRLTALREAAGEIAEQRGIDVSRLAMEGSGPLRRLAGLVQLTDYAAVYLGIASGIDPASSPAIQDLDERVVLYRCGSLIWPRGDESRPRRVRGQRGHSRDEVRGRPADRLGVNARGGRAFSRRHVQRAAADNRPRPFRPGQDRRASVRIRTRTVLLRIHSRGAAIYRGRGFLRLRRNT